MGIWKKISDLARANINDLLDKLEDPQKLSELANLELLENKKKALRLLGSAQARIAQLIQQQSPIKNEIKALLERAQNFLKVGNEEETRRILFQKHEAQEREHNLEQELAQEQETIDTLKRGLLALDLKISTLKSGGINKASQKNLENEDAFQTFSRMEEKIENQEYELSALTELLAEQEKEVGAEAKSEASFDKHSDPAQIEQELLAMKKHLFD